MTGGKKDWLVRTQDRDILGPFSGEELVHLFDTNRIRVCDQISHGSGTRWVSADALLCRPFSNLLAPPTENTLATEDSLDLTPTPPITDPDYPRFVPPVDEAKLAEGTLLFSNSSSVLPRPSPNRKARWLLLVPLCFLLLAILLEYPKSQLTKKASLKSRHPASMSRR